MTRIKADNPDTWPPIGQRVLIWWCGDWYVGELCHDPLDFTVPGGSYYWRDANFTWHDSMDKEWPDAWDTLPTAPELLEQQ